MFRDDCSTALVAACALIDGFESTDPVEEEEEGARERDRKQKKNEWKNRNGRRRRRRRRRRERQKKKKKNERETTRFLLGNCYMQTSCATRSGLSQTGSGWCMTFVNSNFQWFCCLSTAALVCNNFLWFCCTSHTTDPSVHRRSCFIMCGAQPVVRKLNKQIPCQFEHTIPV